MEKATPIPGWQIYKENVMPIKEGRSATALNSSLKPRTPQRNEAFKKQIQQYEAEIADYVGNDPIVPWLKFIKWLQENSPSDSRKLTDVMEDCMKLFTESALYKQDERFLNVWLKYIMFKDYEAGVSTFSFMKSNRIGTERSLFYLAEAVQYESNGKYEKAEKAYQEGITSNASPLAQLLHHQKHFHRRLRRLCINRCKELQAANLPLDSVLSPVEENGLTMQSIRRLEELYATSRQTSAGTNRIFGVLQEVDSGRIRDTPLQNAALSTPTIVAKPLAFKIATDSKEAPPASSTPFLSARAIDHHHNENEQITSWENMRIQQMPGTVRNASIPFAIYSDTKSKAKTREIVPLDYNQALFSTDGSIENELSFEEYRAQFYKKPSFAPPIPFVDPATRQPRYEENPREGDLSGEMTVNTKSAFHDILDIFNDKEDGRKNDYPIYKPLTATKKRPLEAISIDDNSTTISHIEKRKEVDVDKENVPVSYASAFGGNRASMTRNTSLATDQRKSMEEYRNMVSDIESNNEGLTKDDSEALQNVITKMEGRKSTSSGVGRSSDAVPLLNGRRDTIDGSLISGIGGLLMK